MRFTFLAISMLVLTACGGDGAPESETDRALPGPSEEVAGEGSANVELCDAATYRPKVGSNVSASNFAQSATLRVFGVNQIITQDYVPQRTNIVYNSSGRILRVYCG